MTDGVVRSAEVPKGLPSCAAGLSPEEIVARGWEVARGEVPLPAATLSRRSLDHNIATMARWCAGHGVLLAPHSKTAMAPELIRRQLEAGAWGVTVSTARHAEVAVAAGARRLIVAHEIVDAIQLGMLAELADGGIDVMVFVDSAAGVDRLAHHAVGNQRLTALVEMGLVGGRTGVRTTDELLSLLEVVQAKGVGLAGVSAYEGLLYPIRRTLPPEFGSLPPDLSAVTAFVERVAEAIAGARDRGLLPPDAIVTAGGSASFDIVADVLRGIAGPVVLRSGCYVTHDDGAYTFVSPLQEGNDPRLDAADALHAALRVWAHVVSTPEPARAVINAGRRDVGDDIGRPVLLARVEDGAAVPARGWTITELWDQYARLDAAAGATPLAVGDVVMLGVSHPCTTFDKWRVLLEVDDTSRVASVIETRF